VTPETRPAPTVTGEMQQLRPVEETTSAFQVVKEHFFPSPNAPQAEAVVTEDIEEVCRLIANEQAIEAYRKLGLTDDPLDGLGWDYYTDEAKDAYRRIIGSALRQHQSEVEALREERDEALRQCVKYAREAGEAKGRLEASEWPGVVEGWKERATKAEAENARLREALDNPPAELIEAVCQARETVPDIAWTDSRSESIISIERMLAERQLKAVVEYLRQARDAQG